MNTLEDTVSGEYRKKNYSPTKKAPQLNYENTTDKLSKKSKKWSFGNFFRRKKTATYSSSDEEQKVSKGRTEAKEEGSTKVGGFATTNLQDMYKNKNSNEPSMHPVNISTKSYPRTCNMPFSDNELYLPNFNFQEGRIKQMPVDSVHKRSRKESAKVRAEIRRNSLNINSSSDEDSQQSNASSKLRSHDGFYKLRDSFSRKSKAARTERYLKRHSRDGENPHNYLRISKSDAESSFLTVSDDNVGSGNQSALDSEFAFSSVSSQPPGVIGCTTVPVRRNNNDRLKANTFSTNPSHKSNLPEFYVSNTKPNSVLNSQRSISYDAIIREPQVGSQIISAKLELGRPRSNNLTVVDSSQTLQYRNTDQPPVPPIRDWKRLDSYEGINKYSNLGNTSYYKLYGNHSTNNLDTEIRNLGNSSLFPELKTYPGHNVPQNVRHNQVQRPSSAGSNFSSKLNTVSGSNSDSYRYLTEKQSRSRKPICIQNYMKTEQTNTIPIEKNSSSFELLNRKLLNCNSQDRNTKKCDKDYKLTPQINILNAVTNSDAEKENVSGLSSRNTLSPVEKEHDYQYKSTNLDEALNELEAIYNSLNLGDENLLDMAEKRETEIANQNYYNAKVILNESPCNYKTRDKYNSEARKYYCDKSCKLSDIGIINKEFEDLTQTIQNSSSELSSLSNEASQNEPDITLDDVVYRNIKQLNKIKVPKHPPPFGIPLGPVTLTANSDYLHAVPDTDQEKSKRMPDLVKDDLAYRNLRKDSTRVPVLPPVSPEDLKNNNLRNNCILSCYTPKTNLWIPRNNKAVCSKSASIGSLISQQVIERASRRNARDKNIDTEYGGSGLANLVATEEEALEIENQQAVNDINSTSFRSIKYPPISSSSNGTKGNNICDRNPVDGIVKRDLTNNMSVPSNITSLKVDSNDSSFKPIPYKENLRDKIALRRFSETELNESNIFDSIQTLNNNSPSTQKCDEGSEKFRFNTYESDPELLPNLYGAENRVNCSITKNNDNCVREANVVPLSSKKHSNVQVDTLEDHDYENISSDLESKSAEVGKSEDEISFEGEFNEFLESLLNSSSAKKEEIEQIVEEHDYCNLDSSHQVEKLSENQPGESCIDCSSDACNNISECACDEDNIRDSNTTNLKTHLRENLSGTALKMSSTLKSPKLVLETSRMNQFLRGNSDNSGILNGERRENNSSDARHIPDHPKSAVDWHNNPATITTACSFGIACFHQLAALDLFALISIIFGVLSIITAFLS